MLRYSATRFASNISCSSRLLKSPASLKSFSTLSPFSRKSKSTDDEDAMNAAFFDEQVKNIIITIRDVVKPLEELNPTLKLTDNGVDTLTIVSPRGKYSLHVSSDRQKLIFQSFISGYHQYYFDTEDQLWLSIKDKHDLRGLLTRDLLKHIIGCPNF